MIDFLKKIANDNSMIHLLTSLRGLYYLKLLCQVTLNLQGLHYLKFLVQVTLNLRELHNNKFLLQVSLTLQELHNHKFLLQVTLTLRGLYYLEFLWCLWNLLLDCLVSLSKLSARSRLSIFDKSIKKDKVFRKICLCLILEILCL